MYGCFDWVCKKWYCQMFLHTSSVRKDEFVRVSTQKVLFI